MQNKNLFAAVDLGSNSFRLEIARLENGHLRRLQYIKETVRQGNGLDAERLLSEEAMARGWNCLARFAERIRGFTPAHVRAVATQTLREARNRDVFLNQAHQILGFPIEVITGREEARLIYLGVSHLLPDSDERRLVIDIGGRSTELILGKGLAPQTLASYPIGSVDWSMKHFPGGIWTASAFKAAEIAAQSVLDDTIVHFPFALRDQVYGSSGTVGAVADAMQANGRAGQPITREGLDWLKEQLIKAQSPQQLQLDGIREDRLAVIGGGLAVLRALFDLLKIECMHPAQGALRHGALFDLMDRENPTTDVRTRMIDWLTNHFATDQQQAEQVACTGLFLFDQMVSSNRLPEHKQQRQQLQWAARLHEIGMLISHSDCHKHGAYILENTDLQGFTIDELQRLGLLVLGHRGKLRKLGPALQDSAFVQILMALRLAVILCHARRKPSLDGVKLNQLNQASTFQLTLTRHWVQQFPQSAHLLSQESGTWEKAGIRLRVSEV